MLLNFYVGSVIICFLVTTLCASSFQKRAEREGYKTKENKTSLVEKVYSNLNLLLKMSIPLFNIIVTLAILFKGDEMYEKIKEEGIRTGNLIPTEEEIEEYDEKSNLSNNKSCFTNEYDELSIKEKIDVLEKEKERLIDYQNSTDTKEKNRVLKYNMINNKK